jgi:hypothetical protein
MKSNTAMKAAPPRATKPAKPAPLKVAAPTRSAERQRLANAISRRDAAALALDAGRRALVRATDGVAKAEERLESARHAVTTAGEQFACALAEAIESGGKVPPKASHSARARATWSATARARCGRRREAGRRG